MKKITLLVLSVLALAFAGCVSNQSNVTMVHAGETVTMEDGYVVVARNHEPLVIQPKMHISKVDPILEAHIRAIVAEMDDVRRHMASNNAP